MKLIIVESPSKATTIQKYLGDEYHVMASMGHICDLAKGGKYGIGINVNDDFKPYYVLMKDKISLLDEMIAAAEKSDEILLFSDGDREGESIASHIKKYLVSTGKPIKRGRFNEITKSAILKAIKNADDIDLNLVKAQEARRALDRIVGFMVSPYLINNYGSNLSAGRVQSVAVRMIADREKEIDSFKPEEFWNISVKFKSPTNIEFTTKLQGAKITNKAAADLMIGNIKDQEFYVASVISSKKKEKPPAPLTTSTLQQYMAKKFSFEPDRTMSAAQSLYESGFCTYIRTDSTRISDEAVDDVRSWITDNKLDLPKKPNAYETKASAQDAHECIRPTNVKTLPNSSILSGDDKEVYAVIWQHFVACQMNPAIWNTLQVNIKSKQGLTFTTSGKALEYKGYLEIFGSIDIGKIEIPNLQENDILTLSDKNPIKADQKFTQPLPRFNNASIIKELEDKQIGRPATYAEIIKKITARNYVEKSGNNYKPTDIGKKITTILVNLFPFMDYKYTQRMEEQLDDIAAGKIDYVSMLNEFFIPFKAKLDAAYVSSGSTICAKCGGIMMTRSNPKDQTTFSGCNNYPRCRYTSNTIQSESRV